MGKYNVIISVARLQNITKAADELGYSQPNISHMISKIEEELGVRLFDRGSHRKVTLTNRTLRVGSFSSVSAYRIPSILQEFVTEHPERNLADQ